VTVIPGCTVEAPCVVQRSVTDVLGVGFNGLLRPLGASSPLALSAGVGTYRAGPVSDGLSDRAFGLNGGITTDFAKPTIGLAVRVHYFPSGLAEIRWLVTPAIRLSF
jgi:hypothetical protein